MLKPQAPEGDVKSCLFEFCSFVVLKLSVRVFLNIKRSYIPFRGLGLSWGLFEFIKTLNFYNLLHKS